MKFGLMFFASNEESLSGEKYRLVLESARFADANGFESVWVPERHFTEFGSLYPNPVVLHAALATCTNRVKLMAGSVVAPLHHPLRIAEEWSMVDNLSGGRVGISFASGWNPDDFVLNPGGYATRQQAMHEAIRTVQHVWRGGTLDSENGKGEARKVRVYPTPVQPELPVWITAAGNPETFRKAGGMGANLLTHILDQDEEQLAQKIRMYRDAREEAGFDPDGGSVTAMLHTFVGDDAARVREEARTPFCNYIRSNIGLLNGLAQSRGQQVDVRSMPAKQLDDFVNFLYERFAQSRGLIGTSESCLPLVRKLEAMGVDEIACLLDFGPPVETILKNLQHLQQLQLKSRTEVGKADKRLDLTAVQARCGEPVGGVVWQERLRAHGITSGENFETIWRGSGEVLVRIVIDPSMASSEKQALLLNAGVDMLVVLGREETQWTPSGFEALRRHTELAGAEFWIHAVVSSTLDPSFNPPVMEGEIGIFYPDGSTVFELHAMRLQAMNGMGGDQKNEESKAVSDLLYRRAWNLLQVEPPPPRAGYWLIIADQGGFGTRLAGALEAVGGNCRLSFDAPAFGGFDKLLHEDTFDGILYLRCLDLTPTDIPGRREVSADVLEMVRALAPNEGARSPRLWLLTSGAMPVLEGERPSISNTPLWGLGQAISSEHPAIWGGLLDLDPDLANAKGSSVWEVIDASNGEDMLALRKGRLYTQRIVRYSESLVTGLQSQQKPLKIDQNGTYLVTGRLNGLGLHLTAWLRAHGAQHIALVGRSDPTPGSPHDRFFRCDLSNLEDTVAAIREIEHSMPPLKGVFHLAGTLDDGLLLHQSAERFYANGTGKAEGAWNLHLATEAAALDYFVLYSTVATLLTVPGQASYAAANIVLDALAHLRRAEGKPALCVNWGPWSELGMTATDYGRAANERLAAAGIEPLDPEIALDMLERLMAEGVTQSAVARIDWARLFAGDPRSADSPLLFEFREADKTPAYQETELTAKLRTCSGVDRADLLGTVIANMVAESLRLPDAISPTQSFFDLGADSIVALELTNRLSTVLGRSFPGTLLFTSPTVETLTERLLLEMEPFLNDTPPTQETEDLPHKVVTDESMELELTEEELSRLIAQEIGSR